MQQFQRCSVLCVVERQTEKLQSIGIVGTGCCHSWGHYIPTAPAGRASQQKPFFGAQGSGLEAQFQLLLQFCFDTEV